MNSERFDTLRERSTLNLEKLVATRHGADARQIIQSEVARLIADGDALELSDEEERMLRSFRRFKLRMRKNGEVFKWQTRVPDGVEVVAETGLIADPAEGDTA